MVSKLLAPGPPQFRHRSAQDQEFSQTRPQRTSHGPSAIFICFPLCTFVIAHGRGSGDVSVRCVDKASIWGRRLCGALPRSAVPKQITIRYNLEHVERHRLAQCRPVCAKNTSPQPHQRATPTAKHKNHSFSDHSYWNTWFGVARWCD